MGELFGSAFDDVLRRPSPALVPLVTDVTLLLFGAVVFSATIGTPLFAQAPQGLPVMPFAIPEALPTITDVRDPTGLALSLGPRAWLALAGVTAVALPVAAFARGGFLGLLLEAYLPRRDDPLDERLSGLDEMWRVFRGHGSAHFGPLLLLGVIDVAVALAAVLAPRATPFFTNSLLGLVAFEFLTLFAPYAVVVEGRGAFAALRQSVRTVTDFLASCLVAALFGLLTTGGVAALLGPAVTLLGPAGLAAAAVPFAPLGTVLALFYLKVFVSLRPVDRLPTQAGEAPATLAHPTEA